MHRRDVLKAATALAATGVFGLSSKAFAAEETMATVVKIIGVSYFNILGESLVSSGRKFGIDATMVGPAHVDPAQQVRLVEDMIAKKVKVIGLVPLDVKVLGPVVQRAREAGIHVITQEGPDMAGRTWDVEMVDSTAFGEMMMKTLAKQMGGKGQYICIVGTLTTPLHNLWCDAAIAYQKTNFPGMELAATRFPGADEVDTSAQVMRDALQAYPDLRGVIGYGANGPIGAGNVVRQRHLQDKIAVTGFSMPSPAKMLVESGAIKEAFLWSPKEVGEAMVAVASLVLKNAEFKDGMEIPGLGKAKVDVASRRISVDRPLTLNKESLNGLIAQGL